MVSNASYLICIFINFNENIKMTEKNISGPNYQCDTLLLSHKISYNKSIDVIGLNKNYLIYIFININEIVKNR